VRRGVVLKVCYDLLICCLRCLIHTTLRLLDILQSSGNYLSSWRQFPLLSSLIFLVVTTKIKIRDSWSIYLLRFNAQAIDIKLTTNYSVLNYVIFIGSIPNKLQRSYYDQLQKLITFKHTHCPISRCTYLFEVSSPIPCIKMVNIKTIFVCLWFA
jgi:hypothetical protein